jgi:hypothetical protein
MAITWTSQEIPTKSGFYVAPANSNPASEEISFLVARIDDERSSDLCKKIEQMALSSGGITIRSGAISREAAMFAGFGSGYYSGLFHENCRCRLVVKPKALYEQTDVLDLEIAAGNNSVTYNELFRLEKKLEKNLFKQFVSMEFRNRLKDIMSFNFLRRKR